MSKLITVYCLLITVCASCLTYDLNSDDVVNLLDYEQFADGWQTTYDSSDLIAFGGEWLSYGGDCDGAPLAKPQIVRYASGDPVTINLAVTGSYATISIESLPANGTLLSDGNDITSVPFALAAAEVVFTPSGESGGAFSFSATDNIAAPCGGQTSATVQIVWSKPQAAAINYTVEVKVGERLVFAGSDPDNSGHLRYVIIDYSEGMTLVDPLGGPVYKKPWAMLRNMPHIICGADSVGGYTVKYKTSDEQFISDEATVNVTVAANSQDALFFDGQDDYISLADSGDVFDLVSGRAIFCFVKTAQRSGCVLKKRGAGAGYELWIINHTPHLLLYDPNGLQVYAAKFDDYTSGRGQLDNQWCHLGFSFKPDNAPSTQLWTAIAYTTNDGVSGGYNTQSNYRKDLPSYSYGNSEPLVVMQGVRGGFDALRFHNNTNPADPTGVGLVFTQTRSNAGTATFMVAAAAITFQFRGVDYLKNSTAAYTFTASGSPSREPLDFYYNSIFER